MSERYITQLRKFNLMSFKPMLAKKIGEDEVDGLHDNEFWAQPKLDGFRCIIHPELGPVSRSLKPIRNSFVRAKLQKLKRNDLIIDGELMVKFVKQGSAFNAAQLAFARRDGEPEFVYNVFDGLDLNKTRLIPLDRWRLVEEHLNKMQVQETRILDSFFVDDHITLGNKLNWYLSQGYEGLILRGVNSPYKFGRSTQKESALLAIKPMDGCEIEILDYECLRHNYNKLGRNELGYAKRASDKDGQEIDPNRAGSIQGKVLNGFFKGQKISVGSGFTDDQREDIVNNWHSVWHGKVATIKYQLYGAKDKPRAPVFVGLRPEMEASE